MLNIGSSLDSQLKSRAANLHSNNIAVDAQISSLQASTKALAKDTDKLKKVADNAARQLKELGNVQNWAEVMEREFLILEETMRLAAESGSEEEDYGPCRVCGRRVEEEGDDLLWCRGCDGEFHKECVGLESVPAGEWHCAECEQQGTYLQHVGDAGKDDLVQNNGKSKDEDVQMSGMEVEDKGKEQKEESHHLEIAVADPAPPEADAGSTSTHTAGEESSLNQSSTSNTTGEDSSLNQSSISGDE